MIRVQKSPSLPCLLDLSRSNKQRAAITDGKESLFFGIWSWRCSIMTARVSFTLQLFAVSALSYALSKKEQRVSLVFPARSTLFPWKMLDIFPSITEATNKRKIFESRDSFLGGSLQDISNSDLWLEYNQKMLEVAHETTIDILDLSCETKQRFTYNISHNPWPDNTLTMIQKMWLLVACEIKAVHDEQSTISDKIGIGPFIRMASIPSSITSLCSVLLELPPIVWHRLNTPWRDKVKCGWYIFLFIDNLIVDVITLRAEVNKWTFPFNNLALLIRTERYDDIVESCSRVVSWSQSVINLDDIKPLTTWRKQIKL